MKKVYLAVVLALCLGFLGGMGLKSNVLFGNLNPPVEPSAGVCSCRENNKSGVCDCCTGCIGRAKEIPQKKKQAKDNCCECEDCKNCCCKDGKITLYLVLTGKNGDFLSVLVFLDKVEAEKLRDKAKGSKMMTRVINCPCKACKCKDCNCEACNKEKCNCKK